jgi:hypothetical protein
MLNVASNAGAANVYYPPTDATRTDTVRHLSNIMWDARGLMLATAPRADGAISDALAHAVAILRAI